MTKSTPALSGTAFLTLMLIAVMMGANHVAARTAFNHGVNVATAVTMRSGVTALVVAILLLWQGVSWRTTGREKKYLVLIGVLVAAQSICLYSAVARLPVALALLVFNTYPLSTALWARILYGQRTPKPVLMAMPVLLLGLALALDVTGAASSLSAAAHWSEIGTGVAFGLGASFTFGLALVWTQHETGALDGRLRTFTTMSQVGLIAGAIALSTGGLQWPAAAAGWWGLAMLTLLYGTAFTIMFTVLPKLGVVGNSALMNVEPVFALVLAWLLLDQQIAPAQIVGALVVVATVVALGLRKS